MRVLVACEYSGRVRDAFIRRGHDAISCDLLPSETQGPHHVGDVCSFVWHDDGAPFDLLIAHPPCTRLTNAGVRWLKEPPMKLSVGQYPDEVVAEYSAMSRSQRLAFMWRKLEEGAEFYDKLTRLPIERKCIENPIMHRYARKLINPGYRQVVQPWWFGEPAFKATGLELINLPDLVPTNKLTPPKSGTREHAEWSKVHRASPGPDRWKERSRTYHGIAEAMAEQWGKL